MKERFNKLSLIDSHYLKIAKESSNNYFDEFIEAISNLESVITKKDFNIFWNDKMQLNKSLFNEKAFIQGACEIAVANYFKDEENFIIEAKVNPNNNKDVDCQFSSNDFIYNIEVKCASFDALEKAIDSDSFKFQSYGRLEGMDVVSKIISDAISEGLEKQGKEQKPFERLKNMDNNLKDFLTSAHQKFNSDSSEKELNILLVCCNDKEDMQRWVGYLTSSNGLFTQDPFSEKGDYENVDVITFTNLYFKHKDFHKKSLKNSWTLEHTLNFHLVNPYRLKPKNNAILNYYDKLKHYSNELNDFEVLGNVPETIKEARRIPHFVIEYLERDNSIYLFETPKTLS